MGVMGEKGEKGRNGEKGEKMDKKGENKGMRERKMRQGERENQSEEE